MSEQDVVQAMLSRLREIRDACGLSAEQVDELLIFGPGWTERFERGETIPTLDILVALLQALDANLSDLVDGLDDPGARHAASVLTRAVSGEQDGNGLVVRFRYGNHDASHRLAGATLEEFDGVLKTLRDGLAKLISSGDEKAIKTEAVASSFLKAVETWPDANPSDLWWFVVSRAYQDTFNHPARFARLNLDQSWKRTGGWALEEVLVRHYGPALEDDGIRLFIARGEEKTQLLDQLVVSDRLEYDKVDVVLAGEMDGEPACFGVVHVKASFAERRTDDVPMSKALVDAGYTSPLWTMDSKSSPAASPRNRGELGAPKSGDADKRSAKRKDIEDDGYFSACFSYNKNTYPTPAAQDAKARIVVCDFNDPAGDAFAQFVRREWERFEAAQ